MPEVIEILSSSPPASSSNRGRSTGRKPLKTLQNRNFESSEGERFADHDDFLDSNIAPPLKRQRFNTTSANEINTSHVQVLDLSDEGSLPEIQSLVTTRRSEEPFQLGLAIVAEDDEITFSSSAPELRRKSEPSRSRGGILLSDDLQDDGDLEILHTSLDSSPRPMYSTRTTELLATLSQNTGKKKVTKSRPQKVEHTHKIAKPSLEVNIADDVIFSSSQAPATTKPKPPTVPQTTKAASRAAAKAVRDAEKEAEKEARRLDRERKAQERQKAADLAEVNKSRTNKKYSATEMIINVTGALKGTSIGNQIEEHMRVADIEMNYIEEELDMTEPSTEKENHGNIIKWRRKVTSDYNGEEGQWEPASQTRIIDEKHILVHIPAVKFASLIASTMTETSPVSTDEQIKAGVDAHVASVRLQGGKDCIPIYVIEGISSWLKKNTNAKNREYTAAVRAQMAETESETTTAAPAGSQARSRKRKKPTVEAVDLSFVTADVVEEVLLHLQLAHQPILIQHTTSPMNSAAQISALTQHLSTRPYRLAQVDYNLKNASFCMDNGQVRTGDNPRETFAKMLQEVQRVTPSMAYGILDSYASVRKLVEGYEKHGNLLLQDVRKSTNKDGAWSDRKLGPMVSKRLYKVFMGRDPSATDGMS